MLGERSGNLSPLGKAYIAFDLEVFRGDLLEFERVLFMVESILPKSILIY